MPSQPAGHAALEHGIDVRIWARAGFWRLRDLFASRARAADDLWRRARFARSPEQVAAMQEAGWEIVPRAEMDRLSQPLAARRAADMAEAIRLHREVTGSLPRGWYAGRCSVNTVDLATEARIFDYVSDTWTTTTCLIGARA